MDELVHSIEPKSAFIGKPHGRVVVQPNGTVSFAPRPNTPIPKTILNMGRAETFPINMNVNEYRKAYRRQPALYITESFRHTTRPGLIRFIMFYYYFYTVYNPSPETQRQLYYFRRAYAKLSTRNWRNTSTIPVAQMYRFLSKLNKPTLIKFARLIED